MFCMCNAIWYGVKIHVCLYHVICFGVKMNIYMYHTCLLCCHELAETIALTVQHAQIAKTRNWKWAYVLTLYNTTAWKCYLCTSSVAYLPLLLATYQPTHSLFWRKALLVRRWPSLNRLVSISQGIQTAPQRMLVCNIQASSHSVLHQWKTAQPPTCPWCSIWLKTQNHVMCCPQDQTTWFQYLCKIATALKSTLHTSNPIYDAYEHVIRVWQEGDLDLQWPSPLPTDNDLIDKAIFLAYTRQLSIWWSHALRRHLCLHWGATLSINMQYRDPYNTFKPTQWTRTLIWTICEYTYSWWIDCNNTVHGATLTASRATHRIFLMTQITEGIQQQLHNSHWQIVHHVWYSSDFTATTNH